MGRSCTNLGMGSYGDIAERQRVEALEAENQRLRDLYENAVKNRDRFGWTINHLLECDDALREVESRVAALEAELAKQEAVMVAADRIHDAYEAMLAGEDIGRLPEWEKVKSDASDTTSRNG